MFFSLFPSWRHIATSLGDCHPIEGASINVHFGDNATWLSIDGKFEFRHINDEQSSLVTNRIWRYNSHATADDTLE